MILVEQLENLRRGILADSFLELEDDATNEYTRTLSNIPALFEYTARAAR